MPVPVINRAQMREWEKATWAAGRSEADVIRLVGKVLAQTTLRLTRPGDRILILAGKGHNGDDVRAARQHLSGRQVEMLEVNKPQEDVSKLDSLLALQPAVIMDGLFGIGINRPLDHDWVGFIERINAARKIVLAVDIPSGLNGDTGEPEGAAVRATVTLTVGAPKQGLLQSCAWPYVGRLEVAPDVGLISCPQTSDLLWTLPEDFAEFPPPRAVASHKGTFGRLGILAGSPGYHGAAVLTARGAQRARPGLITLFTHESVYPPVAAQLQAVMVHRWEGNIGAPGEFNALLIGPGLASPELADETRQLVRRLWKSSPTPMVMDASALDWLAADSPPPNAIRVITPHPGEAARLLKTSAGQVQSNRPDAVRKISRQFGNCWVVLKGHQTLVGRSTGAIFVNPSGNPYLAQGGTGDVLAGYVAGLLAQPELQADISKTIRYGVWQHGAAGDLLQAAQPNWVVENLIEVLGICP